jgi:hypothetical protein
VALCGHPSSQRVVARWNARPEPNVDAKPRPRVMTEGATADEEEMTVMRAAGKKAETVMRTAGKEAETATRAETTDAAADEEERTVTRVAIEDPIDMSGRLGPAAAAWPIDGGAGAMKADMIAATNPDMTGVTNRGMNDVVSPGTNGISNPDANPETSGIPTPDTQNRRREPPRQSARCQVSPQIASLRFKGRSSRMVI